MLTELQFTDPYILRHATFQFTFTLVYLYKLTLIHQTFSQIRKRYHRCHKTQTQPHSSSHTAVATGWTDRHGQRSEGYNKSVTRTTEQSAQGTLNIQWPQDLEMGVGGGVGRRAALLWVLAEGAVRHRQLQAAVEAFYSTGDPGRAVKLLPAKGCRVLVILGETTVPVGGGSDMPQTQTDRQTVRRAHAEARHGCLRPAGCREAT